MVESELRDFIKKTYESTGLSFEMGDDDIWD